ncbi:BrnT family toxin [Microbulbifer sp. VAAF005]|uniref:BrnT family toxin n=1 Tax=Microbulbifer sp. VAAF005 TaxID=3034230 RepID=UPI0024ADD0BF|nr:BrnT family toxin [Microbulbifer sp. VAAF005]WHI45055.1 BrnT family toxin [Microbulbifer sp. VAAF005]
MDFEWDENKRQRNLDKHNIDFAVATEVFQDQERIETEDTREDYGEERIQVIGMARPGILFVVYTERNSGNSYRLISARRANRKERAIYNSMLGQ